MTHANRRSLRVFTALTALLLAAAVVRLHHVPHHEKGGGGVVLLQRVQDGLRVPVFVPAVKGEIDYFFGTIPQIIRPVLGQLLLGGIAHRGLALVLEGQAPVPGHGDGGGGPGGADRLLIGQGEDHGGGEQPRGHSFVHAACPFHIISTLF